MESLGWLLATFGALIILGTFIRILNEINYNLRWLKEYIEDRRP